MPPILDAAIGTVFVFLLFSLVVSALNEYILSLTDQRAKFMRMGLAELFGQKAAAAGYLKRFGKVISGGLFGGEYAQIGKEGEALLQHGLINAFSRSDSGTTPSYIPAGAFVTALLDIVASKDAPVTTDTNQLGKANTFLAKLQAVQPSAGATMTLTAFEKLLTDFIADYNTLPAAPPSDNPLAKLKERVNEALLRAKAQGDLMGAGVADLVSAQGVIDALADHPLKKELNGFVQKAGTDFSIFRQAIRDWFSLNDSRDALEAATASTIVGLIRSATEHAALAIETGINRIQNVKLKASLLSLFHTVDGDVEKFKLAVEGWFNAVMDRVSGWYKRFSQKWMIAIGFILAAVFNVDTIEIVRVLSNNRELASAVAAQAQAYSEKFEPQQTWEDLKNKIEIDLKTQQERLDHAKAEEDAATKADPIDKEKLSKAQTKRHNAQSELDRKKEELLSKAGNSAQAQFSKSVDDLKKTGLPMGWGDQDRRKELGLDRIGKNGQKGLAWFFYYPYVYTDNFFDHFPQFLALIGGWFVTAIAASIGAPFWFDLLGRFINIRAAGRSPGEKETTSSPTKPPPANIDTTPGTR